MVYHPPSRVSQRPKAWENTRTGRHMAAVYRLRESRASKCEGEQFLDMQVQKQAALKRGLR